MAGSYAYDGTLLDVAGQGVAVDGDWFELLNGGGSERRPINIQFIVSMPVGTGTWILEGRNGSNDSPTQLDTGTAAKTGSYPRMAQMRLRWTAAAGLTARGSVSATLKNVTYTPFAVQSSLWYNGLIGGYWPGGLLASDSFTRADNAVSLGLADTGQAWSALAGTWGVLSNQAYQPSGLPDGVAILDVGEADVTLTVTLSTVAPDNGLILRASDTNNYIRLIFEAGVWYLQKKVAGAFTTLASGAGSNTNGDMITLTGIGSSLSSTLNGVALLTATDAFNATATKHGITGISASTRFDNFSAS
jgi:hypothetical protein